MRTCEEAAYRMASEAPPTIDLTPEPWDVATLTVLAMAGTSAAIGVVWRAGPGFRAFLRRSAIVAAGSWLDMEAFLVGEAGYEGPLPEECGARDDLGAMSLSPRLRIRVPVTACPREVPHDRAAATGYLAGGTGLLWIVAAATSVATRRRPTSPDA